MYSDTRTAYGRMILHNEPLGLDDKLAGYDTAGTEQPLITPGELLALPQRKQTHTYVRSILLSRAAHYNALEQSDEAPATIFGDKLSGEKNAAMLCNGYLLKLRRSPGLVLLGPNDDDPFAPPALLRLDSLMEYRQERSGGQIMLRVAVKSDAMTPQRVDDIVKGFLHLRKAIGGCRYSLLFMNPAGHSEDIAALRKELRAYGVPVFAREMTESMAQFDDAAYGIMKRLPALKETAFRGEELQHLRAVG